MYIELHALMTGLSGVFMMMVTIWLITVNILFGFLLIMALFFMIFGFIIFGYKYITGDGKPIIEPTPPGKELMELQLLDGRTRFINTVKGPEGERRFRINKQNATVINDGKSNFRMPSGNVGFRAHESLDRNVDPFMCKALEQTRFDNIKEAFYILNPIRRKKVGDTVD